MNTQDAITVVVRPGSPEELPAVIAGLDREFVFGKQRALSLGRRFPNVWSDRRAQILLAVQSEKVLAAGAVRPFDWTTAAATWRGAMVGMVWVEPELRGRGLGAEILAGVSRHLEKERMDFGVLWTGKPDFYARSGWALRDRAWFGEAAPLASADAGPVSRLPLAECDGRELESLRAAWVPNRVTRTAQDYLSVPLPAVRVWCFRAEGNGRPGFALVGDEGETGYFYEAWGPTELRETLWTAARGSFTRLLVNGHPDDSFSVWLAETGRVAWQPQIKAMWLPISDRAQTADFLAWHIPYFDRI